MNKILYHIIVWLVILFFQTLVFKYGVKVEHVISHTIVFIASQFMLFYINYLVLIPRFYTKNKFVIYLIFVMIIIILSSIGITLVEHGSLIEKLSNYSFNFESILAHAIPGTSAIFASFFIFTYKNKRIQEKREIERLTAEKEFLIQQINPHFLFNTLNNIYALVQYNQNKGAESILKLSNLLEHSLYRMSNETNSLHHEIQYIKNYLELFKLKDDEINNITFNHSDCDQSKHIASLLLIPFIENAIKHGNLEDTENGKLIIRLTTKNNDIYFDCENTFDIKRIPQQIGGIGINNIKRRLELIYPSRYNLSITKIDGVHKVNLIIKP